MSCESRELSQIAEDFGIHFTTLYSWLKKADIEDGERPGATAVQSAELREARKRIRLLEQENEVLGRAATRDLNLLLRASAHCAPQTARRGSASAPGRCRR